MPLLSIRNDVGGATTTMEEEEEEAVAGVEGVVEEGADAAEAGETTTASPKQQTRDYVFHTANVSIISLHATFGKRRGT